MRLIDDAGRVGFLIRRRSEPAIGFAGLWIVERERSHEVERSVDGSYDPDRAAG